MIYRLTNDGTVVYVTDYNHRSDPFEDNQPYSEPFKLNLCNYFKNIEPNEWLLYTNQNGNKEIMLPINYKIAKILDSIHTVEFEFTNVNVDAPVLADDINRVKISESNNRRSANACISYYLYQLINYLPYSDFSIDNMPIITNVIVNGEPSNIFKAIIDIINTEFKDVKYLYLMKDGGYKFEYDEEYKRDKKIHTRMIRISDSLPLFYVCSKEENKYFRKLHHIEITLRWYKTSDSKDILSQTDSAFDDYLYSYNTIQSALTLNCTYPFLIKYYMKHEHSQEDKYYLVAYFTLYIKEKNGMQGYQEINTKGDFGYSDLKYLCYRIKNIRRCIGG